MGRFFTSGVGTVVGGRLEVGGRVEVKVGLILERVGVLLLALELVLGMVVREVGLLELVLELLMVEASWELASVRGGGRGHQGNDRFRCSVILLQGFRRMFFHGRCPHAGAGDRVPEYLLQDGSQIGPVGKTHCEVMFGCFGHLEEQQQDRSNELGVGESVR